MIWPFNKINKLETEISAQKNTIEVLVKNGNNLFAENQQLKKYIVDASKVLEKQKIDYENTIAFMKLKELGE